MSFNLSYEHGLIMDQQREIIGLMDPLEPPFWNTNAGYMTIGALISGGSLILLLLSLLCLTKAHQHFQRRQLPSSSSGATSTSHLRTGTRSPTHLVTSYSIQNATVYDTNYYDVPPSYDTVMHAPYYFDV